MVSVSRRPTFHMPVIREIPGEPDMIELDWYLECPGEVFTYMSRKITIPGAELWEVLQEYTANKELFLLRLFNYVWRPENIKVKASSLKGIKLDDLL